MIKLICFDLDGVYFPDSGKKAFLRNLTQIVGDEEKVNFALGSNLQSSKLYDLVCGKISSEEYFEFAKEYLNLNMTLEEFGNLWVKEYEINKEVKALIQKLKESGYKIGVVSNNNPIRIEALEKKFSFLKDFDVSILSYQVGHAKPGPSSRGNEIYKILIDKSGFKGEEIVYSDDNGQRLMGAKELGINTYLFDNFENYLKYLQSLGVEVEV